MSMKKVDSGTAGILLIVAFAWFLAIMVILAMVAILRAVGH